MASTDLQFGDPANAQGSPVSLRFGDDPPAPPAGVQLVFAKPANPAGSPVRLVFGDDGDEGAQPGSVQLDATGRITGLRGFVSLRSVVRLGAGGRITGLRGYVRAAYDVNVERPATGAARAAWQQGRHAQSAAMQPFQQAPRVLAGLQTAWQSAGRIAAPHAASWQQSERLERPASTRFEQALRLGVAPATQSFQQSARLRQHGLVRMEQAQLVSTGALQQYQQSQRLRIAAAERLQQALQRGAAVRDGFGGRALQLAGLWAARFEQSRAPWPGVTSVRPPDPPLPDPCYVPVVPVRLVFGDAAESGLPVRLVFLCERHAGPDPEPPRFVIPLLRTYMIVHHIDAVLLPGNERVFFESLTISSDDDGFGWTMSATGRADLIEQLAPTGGIPQRVRVSIDGIEWVFACEQPERSRKFGERTAQVRGSSLTSLLGAPHMPAGVWSSSSAMTAQQLVLQALEFTGVGLDWRMDDWLVPAGSWSHQGAPLSVALRVAEAAGGVVRSHRTEATLQIAPRYSRMPWAWPTATPDVQMPGQIITADTLQAVAGTRFNAVYVSGETQGGVLGHVVRSGTAGDVLAPQVTDALVTHELAARQRGSSVLAAAAITKRQPITVPLLTGGSNPGLILPGYLIEVVEPGETWRGLVRGLTVTAGMPTVRQQLDVERAV